METRSDFKEIVLQPKEYKELKRLAKLKIAELPEDVVPALSGYQLIFSETNGFDEKGFPIFVWKFSISDKGKRYLVYRKQCRKEAIFRYLAGKWIDFLALIVAVAALIVSIAALRYSLQG